MIEGSVYIQLRCHNNTSISGRAVRYSDPQKANEYGGGAFQFEDADGTKHYVPWAAINHLSVFDLSNGQTPPELTAGTEVKS